MKALKLSVLVWGCAALGCAHSARGPHAGTAARDRLTTFRSDAELGAFLGELARKQQERHRYEAVDALAETVTVVGAPSVSVTNVQHAGVDEGGIVKVCGDYLVVLRRGRLFTVRIGDGALRPVAAVDAFGPDLDPSDSWYDEMLVSGNAVVVIGYSYGRGGTELGLFEVDARGQIRYLSTYHLRSYDYYSSRNYASRLVGRRLVFYTPLPLRPQAAAPLRGLPALRRWGPRVTEDDFRPIYSARRIYAPLIGSDDPTLHTVTTCDLAGAALTCEATAVVGPPGRVFYVSPRAVYIWMTEWTPAESTPSPSLLYRLPLEGGEAQAVRVAGAPTDQLSFLERDGHLNVLVRSEAGGEGMWRAEAAEGEVALLRISLAAFSAQAHEVPAERYRPLPMPGDGAFQNRFSGDFLLYGAGSGWFEGDSADRGELVAYRYTTGGEPYSLRLGHGVDRIESLGADAVVVGTDGSDLRFTTIALGGREPAVADSYTRPEASQGELRTHGFFYLPQGPRGGMLGLPLRAAERPGYQHLFVDSASVLFLRNDRLRLQEMGELVSRTQGQPQDGCRASCVDWYGNARPLFLRGRVLALLGSEIVEGEVDGFRLEERRRIRFAAAARR